MHIVRTGERWAALECLGSGYIVTPVMALDDRGREYVADTKRTLGYLLHCDCGKEWEVKAAEFTGKRRVLDCGCGRAWTGRRVCMSFSTKKGMVAGIEKYAEANTLSLSDVINKAIREMFEREGVLEERIPGIRTEEVQVPRLHKANGAEVAVDPWEMRD